MQLTQRQCTTGDDSLMRFECSGGSAESKTGSAPRCQRCCTRRCVSALPSTEQLALAASQVQKISARAYTARPLVFVS